LKYTLLGFGISNKEILKYLLKKGDSITFKSTILHRKTNTGKSKSISIWANTPPWF